MSHRLTMVGELVAFPDQDLRRTDPIVNLGGRYELSENVKLLFSAGRSLRASLTDDEPILLVYAGLQISF